MEFNTGVIKPFECVQEAWERIKDEYWVLFAVSLVGALIGGISLYVLIGAMVCGILKCYLTRIDGGQVKFDDLFEGFKYFWPSLLVTVLFVVPIVTWTLLLFITIYLPLITAAIMGNHNNDTAILGSFFVGLVIDIVLGLIMIAIHSLLIFSFPLIVDRGLSSWDAVKLSARAASKNVGGICGLIAVNFCIALVGEAMCGVGLYLAIPILTATSVVAYRKVFPNPDGRFLTPPPPEAYMGSQP